MLKRGYPVARGEGTLWRGYPVAWVPCGVGTLWRGARTAHPSDASWRLNRQRQCQCFHHRHPGIACPPPYISPLVIPVQRSLATRGHPPVQGEERCRN